MAKNIMKKTISAVLALTSSVACLATMTACETAHPKVEIVLEFNDETYKLEYELNRNLTPATAKHFLELVDGKFYNGLCIHDYQSSAWYTGAYEYKEDTATLEYRSYLDAVKKLEEKGAFTSTVWNDDEGTDSTYTLYGEFKSNNFSVENGSISNGFGALTMRYTDKGDDATDVSVWCQRSDGEGGNWRSYGYNSATSLFSINVSTSATSSSDYCTFAELATDSVEVLEDLKAAIEEYVETLADESEFAPETEAVVDEEDEYAYANEVFFETPIEPIVIKTATVTKW